jgi:fimbrial isopeptide formation D2 family protein
MAIFIRKIKSLNTKKALAVVTFAGLISFLVSSPLASADGPQFNIFPISYTGELNHDLPLLDGRDVTLGQGWSVSQADHDSRINANPGDVLQFSVYYHNGMPDADSNVALNAVVQAFVSPSLGSTANTFSVSATIGAQNAATVSSADASRGGNIAIHVSGTQAQSLSLVPGSVTWFPLQGSTPPGTAQTLPDTIFSSGVSIGNIRGCFQYHGFVNFKVQLTQVQQGSLLIQKNVRNLSQGLGALAPFDPNQVSANPGDTVEYQILVSAQNNAVQSVSVKDALDPKLTLTGSVTLDGSPIDTLGFFNSGDNIGTVNVGSNREIKFKAVVAAKSQFTVGTFILSNTAYTFSSNSSAQDSANVQVVIQPQQIACTFTWDAPLTTDGTQRGSRHVGDQFNVQQQVTGLNPSQSFNIDFQHVSGSPVFKSLQSADASGNFNRKETSTISASYTPGDYLAFIELNGVNVASCTGMRVELPSVQQISLTKLVRDDNAGGAFTTQVSAQPSDLVSFQLTINPQSSNTTLQNVTIKDTLPAKLTFNTGTLNVNGTPQSVGNFFTTGLNLGTVQPNQQIVVTFQTTVANATNFTAGSCEILTNFSTVTADGGLSSSSSANVQVCKQAPVKQPGQPAPRPLQ